MFGLTAPNTHFSTTTGCACRPRIGWSAVATSWRTRAGADGAAGERPWPDPWLLPVGFLRWPSGRRPNRPSPPGCRPPCPASRSRWPAGAAARTASAARAWPRGALTTDCRPPPHPPRTWSIAPSPSTRSRRPPLPASPFRRTGDARHVWHRWHLRRVWTGLAGLGESL